MYKTKMADIYCASLAVAQSQLIDPVSVTCLSKLYDT